MRYSLTPLLVSLLPSDERALDLSSMFVLFSHSFFTIIKMDRKKNKL